MKATNRAIDAASYNFQEGEEVLVDANIWLYLCPPAAQPTPTWAVVYSRILSALIQAKAQPLVDPLILSEYLNRYVRIEYQASWSAAYPEFKAFRRSADAAPILGAATAEAQQIVTLARPVDAQLENIAVAEVLQAVTTGNIDFNDGLLVENCRSHGWKLLTNDGDMTMGGIEVLTTNSKLLRLCP